MIDNFLLQHTDFIHGLCKEHDVSRLYAFGSIVDGRFELNRSDIDLLIEFPTDKAKKETAKSLLIIWMTLQDKLGCKVDLITSDKLKGKYFKKYLDMYKEEIYSK